MAIAHNHYEMKNSSLTILITLSASKSEGRQANLKMITKK